ncbi:putative transposable element [Trichonephila clavipes]|nr:putative transposable element [Trichonephila clavipes]
MPSPDQLSRRPPHRKKCTRTTNCFIDSHPSKSSTFSRDPCAVSNHTKTPRWRTFAIAAPITCATLDTHRLTPPFGVVPRTSSDGNRVPGERFDPVFASQRHAAPSTGVMVWGTFAYSTRSSSIDPYHHDSPAGLVESFFKNDECHNVTVNGDWYRAIINNFFIPELNNHDVQELWFQQDGATCHTARATIDLLKDTFGDSLISRFVPVKWPPRSCDLTPLDYVLWGNVKSLVYVDKPQTLDHLEDNILRVIADIWPQILEKVIENWTSRLDYIRASRGSPMPDIIFKM